MSAIHWELPNREYNEITEKWEVIEGTYYSVTHARHDDEKTLCGKEIPNTVESADDVSCKLCLRKLQPKHTARLRNQARDKYRPWGTDRKRHAWPTAVVVHVERGRLEVATRDDTITLTGTRIREWLTRFREQGGILYASAAGDIRGLRRLDLTVRWQKETVNHKGSVIKFWDDELAPVHFLPPFVGIKDRHAEFYGFLDFAIECGIDPAGPGTMAWNFWKATWKQGFTPAAYVPEEILREAFKGGREQALRVGSFENARHYDLSMAYPHSMQAEPFPLALRKATRPALTAPVGIAYATVEIPPMPWGPLPAMSATRYPVGTQVQGWHSLRELRLARDLGARVELGDVYEGTNYVDLFSDWYRLMVEARALEHGSRIAKHLANRLWGRFAPNEDSQYLLKVAPDGTRTKTPLLNKFSDLLYLAVDITARVRERVYLQALLEPDIGTVYVATDGVVANGSLAPKPLGGLPGQWREKSWTGPTDVRIVKHGWDHMYAWREDGAWRYVGDMEEERREREFKREWKEQCGSWEGMNVGRL